MIEFLNTKNIKYKLKVTDEYDSYGDSCSISLSVASSYEDNNCVNLGAVSKYFHVGSDLSLVVIKGKALKYLPEKVRFV